MSAPCPPVQGLQNVRHSDCHVYTTSNVDDFRFKPVLSSMAVAPVHFFGNKTQAVDSSSTAAGHTSSPGSSVGSG